MAEATKPAPPKNNKATASIVFVTTTVCVLVITRGRVCDTTRGFDVLRFVVINNFIKININKMSIARFK
jgi:hypothetical protein